MERFLCHSSLPVFSKKQKAVRLKIKNTFLHSYCSSICNSKQTLCFGTFTCHYLQHESFLIPTFKQSWKYSQALAVSMFDIDFRFFLIISAGYTASDHQLSICLLKRQLKETWHISGMSVTPIQIRLVFRINFIYGHAEFGKLLLAKHILVSRKLAKKKHFLKIILNWSNCSAWSSIK